MLPCPATRGSSGDVKGCAAPIHFWDLHLWFGQRAGSDWPSRLIHSCPQTAHFLTRSAKLSTSWIIHFMDSSVKEMFYVKHQIDDISCQTFTFASARASAARSVCAWFARYSPDQAIASAITVSSCIPSGAA